MRRETWAQALDESLQAILDGRATLEQCLARYPQHAARLAQVLPLALKAREALQPPPAREPGRMPASLEARLRAAAAQRRPRPSPGRAVPALRPAIALAAALAAVLLLGATTGAALAAQSALPTDALYPVKRGLEEIQLLLSPTRVGDAALLEAFAERRLQEVEALAAAGRQADLAAGLAEYEAGLARLLQVAGEVPSEDGPGSLAHIEQSLLHHTQVLERIRGQAPEQAQKGLDRALENSRRGREVIEQVLQDRGHGREHAPGQTQQDQPTRIPDGRGRPDRTPGPPHPRATPQPTCP